MNALAYLSHPKGRKTLQNVERMREKISTLFRSQEHSGVGNNVDHTLYFLPLRNNSLTTRRRGQIEEPYNNALHPGQTFGTNRC